MSRTPHSITVTPLGGLEEFGNNSLWVEYHNKAILIDFGLKFAKEPSYGVDYLIPDIKHVQKNAHKLQALIVTHGHLDHIGGIHHLLPHVNIPVYATKFTTMLIQQLINKSNLKDYDLRTIQNNDKLNISPFTIEPIRIDHSIPDAVAFAIQTPVGTIIHSGDFRNEGEPFARAIQGFKSFKDYVGKKKTKNVLAFFSDSTNADQEGHSVSEMEVYRNLDKIFQTHRTRLVFSTFSTQIDRIRKILDLARKHKRKVFLIGKSMLLNLGMAVKGQFIDEYEKLLRPLKEYKRYTPSQVVVIATGSQGEENSALIKLALKQQRDITLHSDDVIVFSSSVIPGNELAVSNLINALLKNGNKIITNSDLPIHTSGHGYKEELKLLLTKLQPKFFIPIHGNYYNLLKHKELALSAGMPAEKIFVIENGEQLQIAAKKVKLLGKCSLRRQHIEAGRISSADKNTFSMRKQLSLAGIVYIFLFWRNGKVSDAWIEGVGVTSSALESVMWKRMKKHLITLMNEKIIDHDFKNQRRVEKWIAGEAKNFLRKENQLSPLIKANIHLIHG